MYNPDQFILLLSPETFNRLEIRSARESSFGDSDEKIAFYNGIILGDSISSQIRHPALLPHFRDHHLISLCYSSGWKWDFEKPKLTDLSLLCSNLLPKDDSYAVIYEDDCDQSPLEETDSSSISPEEFLNMLFQRVHSESGRCNPRSILYKHIKPVFKAVLGTHLRRGNKNENDTKN